MPSEPRRERLRRALAAFGERSPATPSATRSAAVSAVILETGPTLRVLLIERALRATDPWSGHMALPGGHREPGDRDLRATAERETREEVGLDLASADLLGALADRSPARSVDLSIRPFVYWLGDEPALTLSDEVSGAFWIELAPLARGELGTRFEFRGLAFPAWDIDGKIVWGFTYRVLSELLSTLALDSGGESR
jgi:8-oxo-dGTP pyrophosphatase MutT (NUDIX family)